MGSSDTNIHHRGSTGGMGSKCGTGNTVARRSCQSNKALKTQVLKYYGTKMAQTKCKTSIL